MKIEKASLDFLTQLSQNNNRDWFNENKKTYETAKANLESFADAVLEQLNLTDVIETPSGKRALKRIYRDVRFSKNKAPYKQNYGIAFMRKGADRRGSYYIHIEPNGCFIGGGFWGPEKDDLQRIRQHIAADDTELREVINSAAFKDMFGTLEGEQLKTAPKGFDKEHPAIDLLRYKQFLIHRKFSNKEILAADFYKTAAHTLLAMLPLFDVMTDMLTTNLNGESLID